MEKIQDNIPLMDSIVSEFETPVAFARRKLETLEFVVSRKCSRTNSKYGFEMKGTYLLNLQRGYSSLAGQLH